MWDCGAGYELRHNFYYKEEMRRSLQLFGNPNISICLRRRGRRTGRGTDVRNDMMVWVTQGKPRGKPVLRAYPKPITSPPRKGKGIRKAAGLENQGGTPRYPAAGKEKRKNLEKTAILQSYTGPLSCRLANTDSKAKNDSTRPRAWYERRIRLLAPGGERPHHRPLSPARPEKGKRLDENRASQEGLKGTPGRDGKRLLGSVVGGDPQGGLLKRGPPCWETNGAV